MKSFTISSSALLLASFAFAQTPKISDKQSMIDAMDRSAIPQAGSLKSASGSDSDVSSSDTGAQRPLSLSESGISGSFGYDSKLAYKKNPLGAPGELDQQADLVWENAFYGTAKLGVYELDSSVMTPYVGAKWSLTDFMYEDSNAVGITDLGIFNHATTSAYLLLLFQHESGWSFRGGLIYANDRSTENDTEDYMEFYPSIGATKAFSLAENAVAVFDASFGSHYGNVEDADGTGSEHTDDELDHIDATLGYSVIYSFDSYTITPGYSISYRKYDNGFNEGRKDLFHNLSIKLDYPISESFELTLFSDYSIRKSSGLDSANESFGILYDFEKFDLGAGVGLVASF